MNLVNESLIEFKDSQLVDRMLLEGFSFSDLKKLNNPKAVLGNLIKKTNVETNNLRRIKMIGALIVLTSYLLFPKNNIQEVDIESKAQELSQNTEHVESIDIELATKEILQKYNAHKTKTKTKTTIDITDDNVDELNTIVPKRFSYEKKEQYNKYDDDILRAIEELKNEGEVGDAKLIKAIMVIETGMKPRKNSLGYEGFPQTKIHIVQGINKKFRKSFNEKDLYDAKESAKFIHYMIKAIKRSKYVELDSDAVAAYNWGLGNFSKYKNGEKNLPTETSNYIEMVAALTK